jgi:hypothetical protein
MEALVGGLPTVRRLRIVMPVSGRMYTWDGVIILAGLLSSIFKDISVRVACGDFDVFLALLLGLWNPFFVHLYTPMTVDS